MRFLAILTLALSACSLFNTEDGLEQLLRNRERWNALQLRDYDFDYRFVCGVCIPPPFSRIEVRNRTVARVIERQSGDTITSRDFHWPTIDSLFVWTEREFREGFELDITYDGAHHFPAHVSGDFVPTIDDEFSRIVSNFVRR